MVPTTRDAMLSACVCPPVSSRAKVKARLAQWLRCYQCSTQATAYIETAPFFEPDISSIESAGGLVLGGGACQVNLASIHLSGPHMSRMSSSVMPEPPLTI
eukprot:1272348-Amphidinium_carterae.1